MYMKIYLKESETGASYEGSSSCFLQYIHRDVCEAVGLVRKERKGMMKPPPTVFPSRVSFSFLFQ
jgi:hypothetical protein